MTGSKDTPGQKRVCMLLLNDLLHPVDSRVYKEARTLVKSGYDVHVVCWTRRYTPQVMKEVSEGIHVHRIVYEPGPVDAPIIHKVKVFREVRKRMAEYTLSLSPDIVHAHDLETLPIGSLVKKTLHIPLVYDAHEDWPALEARKSRILGVMAGILQRWYIRDADVILTIGKGVAEKLRGTGVKKTILYNSRSAEEIKGLRKKMEKEALGFAKDEFIVGYSGRIDYDLGYDIALEAMKTLKKEGIRLLVVGGPKEMKEYYETLASRLNVDDSCVFTGHVPYERVYDYLSVVDAGLILYESNPLYNLALGNRFFDYLGAGIPIICSDLPEMRRVVEQANCGIILERRDVPSLIDAVRRLKLHPDLRETFRRNALESFRKEFCWEKQEEKLLSVYKKL